MREGFFKTPLFALVLLAAVGLGIWAYIYQHQYDPLYDAIDPEYLAQQASTTPDSHKQTVASPELRPGTCSSHMYESNTERFNLWKSQYQAAHPDYQGVYPDTYCLLQDGSYLVSFAFFKPYSGEWTGINEAASGQSIARFNGAGLVEETRNLFEHTLGDLVPPTIDSIDGETVLFHFGSGDGGYRVDARYKLSLSDFLYTRISTTVWENGVPTTKYYSSGSAAFSAVPTSGIAPLVVRFSQSATDDWRALIEYGDGKKCGVDGPGENANCPDKFVHTYTLPGTYEVKLWSMTGTDGESRPPLGTVTIVVQ